jgi:type VI secretion system protein ImpH
MKYSLTEEPFCFEFFRAIRVLEKLYPDRELIGTNAPPSREVARFSTHATLTFPASQIQDLKITADDSAPPQMTVNFMGLTGPLGVLPQVYTEFVIQRLSVKDRTLRDFLDLFNHRAISLFYHAWEKYHFIVGFDRGQDDRFSQYLFDLIGLGTKGLRGRFAFEDLGLLHYAGLFNQHPHSASGLEGIVRDYFAVPASVEQYVGRRVRLDCEACNSLGIRNTELGVNLILGESVWDRQSQFRVEIGPLSLPRFRSFLPVGRDFVPLSQITRLYSGQECDFDVLLKLKAGEVPECRLLSEGEEGAYLGWSSWLKIREFTADTQDTVLAARI